MDYVQESVDSNWIPLRLVPLIEKSRHYRSKIKSDKRLDHDFNLVHRNECLKNCGKKCNNRRLSDGFEPVKTKIVAYKEPKGRGLRCEEAIKKGDFVIEYIGKCKTTEEYKMEYKANPTGRKYYMTYCEGLVLDAENYGNAARFVNSSCDPNLDAELWFDDEKLPHIVLVAKRDIPINAELTYDYNIEQLPDMPEMICCCGKSNCKDNPTLTAARSNKQIRGNAIEKEFRCPTCDIKFKSMKTLNQHKNFRHSRKKAQFKCMKCDKEFKRKGDLKRHAITHLKGIALEAAKIFECECGSSFYLKAKLKEHFKKKHAYDGKIYECGNSVKGKRCPYSFCSMSARNTHLNHECMQRRLPTKLL